MGVWFGCWVVASDSARTGNGESNLVGFDDSVRLPSRDFGQMRDVTHVVYARRYMRKHGLIHGWRNAIQRKQSRDEAQPIRTA